MRSDGVIGCVLVPVALRSAKRQVADMMRDASAQFVERDHGLFVHKLDSRYGFHTLAMGMISSFLWYRSYDR
jgi:hypothetical protein